MNAVLINIGDELLLGQVLNTNAQWLAQALLPIGGQVKEMRVIADDPNHLLEVLPQALSMADIVLLTGGLGPTRDDMTKEALARYFGVEMVFSQSCWAHMQTLFARFGKRLEAAHRVQCFVPANAELLPNKLGTAPGMWFEIDGKVVVALPGVPVEMRELMEQQVLPRLTAYFQPDAILSRTIGTVGVAESELARRLESFEQQLPPQLQLAYLPNLFEVQLRLTASGADQTYLRALLDEYTQRLKQLLGPEVVYSTQGETLPQALGQMLYRQGLTIATAESCTGGYVGHLLTSVPGASNYYLGGVVAYANHIKVNVLGVAMADLHAHGAVSEPVARQMAAGVRRLTGAVLSVATTGVAGPTGGTADKPVGTVWIAASLGSKTVAKKYVFGKRRMLNIEMSSVAALNTARLLLLELPS